MNITKDRKILELLYGDICDIYSFQKGKSGSFTRDIKSVLYEGVKCALSQKSLNPSNQSSIANAVSYDAKLFTAPELDIPPGSHVEVERNSRVYKFISSGEAFVYDTHQEIMLRRSEKA